MAQEESDLFWRVEYRPLPGTDGCVEHFALVQCRRIRATEHNVWYERVHFRFVTGERREAKNRVEERVQEEKWSREFFADPREAVIAKMHGLRRRDLPHGAEWARDLALLLGQAGPVSIGMAQRAIAPLAEDAHALREKARLLEEVQDLIANRYALGIPDLPWDDGRRLLCELRGEIREGDAPIRQEFDVVVECRLAIAKDKSGLMRLYGRDEIRRELASLLVGRLDDALRSPDDLGPGHLRVEKVHPLETKSDCLEREAADCQEGSD